MCAKTIRGNGQRRHAVGTEALRAQESVLDLDQIDMTILQLGETGRVALRCPHGHGACVRKFSSHAYEREWTRSTPEKRGNMSLLPERETDARGDVAVTVDQRAPETTKLHGL